jgi:hypothetical protein
MNKTLVILVALAGCGGEEPPSCVQAMASYYGAQCVFIDGNTGNQIGQQQMAATCQEVAADIDGICDDQFADWLFCLDDAQGPTDAGCDCSSEFQALLVCGT